ncbi:MAG: hypothetical protein K2K46_05040 [Lachnospiraceae bacterium]|nr:hypothetical protein [Lachnospiraceae bacterium]
MKVTHNIQSLNAIRLVNINIESYADSTGKISSGYKINSAANDPAGLGISEIMRRQIRGLMQATNNTKDGVAFVQSADGAMDEIHSMLQRMNELTDKALNGTWSDSDRMAMNVEFDQLRTEIDRINNTSDFGTGIPLFEQHEPSYYQISGSKKWDDNQLHTISEFNNELNIHLPDSYEPSDYTITVPAGVYTTQELIDEIDDALNNMVPSNPGFVLELTSDGYCNLNFEKADGAPTKIDFVDGSLSYLLFNSFNGSASSSLLGTTEFSSESPLSIRNGQNEQLEFYVQGPNGPKHIFLTISPGDYYRSDMIAELNKQLSKNPDAAGIVAKEYEDSFIQITGGDSVSIFGLKGNMFKVDPKNATNKYSSIFFDNVQYGSSKGSAASVTGKAYYNSSVTDKIHLSSANNNNILRFKVNGTSEYTITFKDGGYTISEICTEINKQIKELSKDYVEVQAGYSESYLSVPSSLNGSSSHWMQYLTLSNLLKGSSSSLEFDTTEDVYVNTYNALFRDTNYLPYKNTGSTAKLTGEAYLKNSFTLPANASLSFTVNDETCTITGIGGTYTNGEALVSVLKSKLDSDFADKIEFSYNKSNGTISINAKTDEIRKISFVSDIQKNDTYRQLFVRTETYTYGADTSWTYGTVTPIEGTSDKNTTDTYASLTIPADKTIKITDDTRVININLYGGQSATITLNNGTYNSTQLANHIAAQINSQLNLSGNSYFNNVKVSQEGNKITLTATPKKSNSPGSYRIYFDDSSAWKAIYGTYDYDYTPIVTTASEATMNTRNALSAPITLDSSNNELTLKLGQGTSMVEATVTIAGIKYNDIKSLAGAVQDAFKGTDLEGKITVDDKSGKLLFTSYAGSITASGSFYDNVIITKVAKDETLQQGTYTGYDDAYIIGRKDLSTESVEIVEGANDVLTFDFTYPDSNGNGSHTMDMNVKIPEGIYTGNEIAKKLQGEIQGKFEAEGFYDFNIEVSIGGEKTGVVGSVDDVALQIKLTKKDGAELPVGQYILDGVRGSAAGFLFYKTTINPEATYVEGTKNLSNGITFKPGQNVLTLSADAVPYQYTFPPNTYYTAEGFADLLNDMFKNGDDNGNSAPLEASIENGHLQIAHKVLGSHSITDIGGTARSTLFLEEEGRDSLDPLVIQVGAEANQTTEIPRISVSSTALGINSVTISKQKYADKANVRIKEAINQLSSKRSIYGAIQNRLEHTINSNDIVIDRMQASESRIRDTDLSTEMVRYSNLSILLQAGEKMLAQSNENIKKLLNLLQ